MESEQVYETRQLGPPTVAESRQRISGAEFQAQLRAMTNKQWKLSGAAGRVNCAVKHGARHQTVIPRPIGELNESSLTIEYCYRYLPNSPNNQPWLGNGQGGIYPNYPNGYRMFIPTAVIPTVVIPTVLSKRLSEPAASIPPGPAGVWFGIHGWLSQRLITIPRIQRSSRS